MTAASSRIVNCMNKQNMNTTNKTTNNMNKQTQAEQTNTNQTNAQAHTKHAASKANIIIHCSIFIIQFNAQYSLFNSIFTICNIILSYSIQLIIQYSLFIIHYSLSIHIRVFIYGPIMDQLVYSFCWSSAIKGSLLACTSILLRAVALVQSCFSWLTFRGVSYGIT